MLSSQIIGKPPKQPALWIANHFSYVDALVVHMANPHLRIVAKADLANEMPDGVFSRFMVRVFNRGGFMWYNRGNDPTIRQRIAEQLRAGKSVVVFSEGTTQRSGPPREMKGGALEIAQECNVPVVPVALRYSMPIGLNRDDSTMRNAKMLSRLENLDIGMMFGEPITGIKDIERVRCVYGCWERKELSAVDPLESFGNGVPCPLFSYFSILSGKTLRRCGQSWAMFCDLEFQQQIDCESNETCCFDFFK